MKKVVLFTAIPDKESFITHLMNAYLRGVQDAGAHAVVVDITALHFMNMIDTSDVTLDTLEPDLSKVRLQILASNHLVFFVEINKGEVNFKQQSFLKRLFSLEGGLPGKALWQPSDLVNKTTRIISVLDGENWKEYKRADRQILHPPIRKQDLQLFGLNTVRTTALGLREELYTDYYYKWVNKMILLGSKQY